MPMTAGIIAASAAIGSLGYGIYSGERANAAQSKAIGNAKQEADQARADQQSQYNAQLAAEQATTQQNLATEAQTKADTQAAQQQALAAEQGAIGTNSTTLSNSLTQQEAARVKQTAPLIAAQMQGSGLVGGGAQAEAYAQYQAGLDANAQSTLANYQIGAQGQLTQDTNAASANQVNLSEQNALLNIQNGEQNMSQNFATQNANNQNNTAYQQYLTSLQLGQAQSQQSAANSYVGLGGQIGGAAMNYYAQQNNPSLAALQMQNNISQYGNQNYVGSNSYNPAKTNASNGGSFDQYMS